MPVIVIAIFAILVVAATAARAWVIYSNKRHTVTVTIGGGGLGWGTCECCHGTWEHLDPHSTRYSESSGCFPLCKGCWRELGTPEARLPFYRILWNKWGADTPGYYSISEWDQIEAAVRDGG